LPSTMRLDLKSFRKLVKAPKIRFASPEDLLEILGLTPGAVSPLGLVNDTENRTIFYVDKQLWEAPIMCCHPNVNTETVQLSTEAFQSVVKATTNEFRVTKLPIITEE